MLTVADLIRYRMKHERYVRRVAEAVLPTRYGDFRMIAYSSDVDHDQHIALIRGELIGATAPLVRVHSHCLTGDVFGSLACDCPELVAKSLEKIAEEGRGVFLYLHHTGRGFRLTRPRLPARLPQIHFHSRGQLDREPARQRMVQHESGIGAQILIDLGLKDIRVVTNHPKKVVALEGYGIRIADQVPLNLSTPKADSPEALRSLAERSGTRLSPNAACSFFYSGCHRHGQLPLRCNFHHCYCFFYHLHWLADLPSNLHVAATAEFSLKPADEFLIDFLLHFSPSFLNTFRSLSPIPHIARHLAPPSVWFSLWSLNCL